MKKPYVVQEVDWMFPTSDDDDLSAADILAQYRLINAAPKLLEALQCIITAIDSGTQFDVMVGREMGLAAIAEVLGEQ